MSIWFRPMRAGAAEAVEVAAQLLRMVRAHLFRLREDVVVGEAVAGRSREVP